MKEFLHIAELNQKKAYEVIEETKVVSLWEAIGAKVNLVGSLKTGLLMTSQDIDFHVYTDELKISESFSVMERLAENPAITRIEYGNGINTEEECIEWHVLYNSATNGLWKLDMIHIRRGSKYDGYFEQVAERISKRITQEEREAILQLKYETPEGDKAMGIEYYRAVMEYSVRTYKDFKHWRKEFSTGGVMEWMP